MFDREEIKLNTNVWYNKKTNQFFSIIEETDTGVICSGFTTFYSDAMTNITRQQLSKDFIQNCLPVNNIDEFPYAELYIGPHLCAWKVKEVKSSGRTE